MPEFRTLREICDLALCKDSDVENWRRYDILQHAPKTRQGAKGLYSQLSALEIAFTAALVSIGIQPKSAGVVARRWLADHSKSKLEPLYARNNRTGKELAFGKVDRTFADLSVDLSDDIEGGWKAADKTPHRDARVISVIDRAAIVADVKRLYAPRSDD